MDEFDPTSPGGFTPNWNTDYSNPNEPRNTWHRALVQPILPKVESIDPRQIVFTDGTTIDVRQSDDRSDLRPGLDTNTYDNPQGTNRPTLTSTYQQWLHDDNFSIPRVFLDTNEEIQYFRRLDREQRQRALTDHDWRDRYNFEHPDDPLTELGQTHESVRYFARLVKPRRHQQTTSTIFFGPRAARINQADAYEVFGYE